jgi:hypothetical protein
VERGNSENFDNFDGKRWNGETTKALVISTENGGKESFEISMENGGKESFEISTENGGMGKQQML